MSNKIEEARVILERAVRPIWDKYFKATNSIRAELVNAVGAEKDRLEYELDIFDKQRDHDIAPHHEAYQATITDTAPEAKPTTETVPDSTVPDDTIPEVPVEPVTVVPDIPTTESKKNETSTPK